MKSIQKTNAPQYLPPLRDKLFQGSSTNEVGKPRLAAAKANNFGRCRRHRGEDEGEGASLVPPSGGRGDPFVRSGALAERPRAEREIFWKFGLQLCEKKHSKNPIFPISGGSSFPLKTTFSVYILSIPSSQKLQTPQKMKFLESFSPTLLQIVSDSAQFGKF